MKEGKLRRRKLFTPRNKTFQSFEFHSVPNKVWNQLRYTEWYNGRAFSKEMYKSFCTSFWSVNLKIRDKYGHSEVNVRQISKRSRVLEKLRVLKIVKKLLAFYETRMFISAFTRSRHLYLSWARSIKSTSSYPMFLKVHFNRRQILPSDLIP